MTWNPIDYMHYNLRNAIDRAEYSLFLRNIVFFSLDII